jgi:hypothetical protein
MLKQRRTVLSGVVTPFSPPSHWRPATSPQQRAGGRRRSSRPSTFRRPFTISCGAGLRRAGQDALAPDGRPRPRVQGPGPETTIRAYEDAMTQLRPDHGAMTYNRRRGRGGRVGDASSGRSAQRADTRPIRDRTPQPSARCRPTAFPTTRSQPRPTRGCPVRQSNRSSFDRCRLAVAVAAAACPLRGTM